MDRPNEPSQLPTALITLEGMTSYRRIEEAFHCKLKGPVVVDKKTLAELQNFQTVSACRVQNFLLHQPKTGESKQKCFVQGKETRHRNDKCVFTMSFLNDFSQSF